MKMRTPTRDTSTETHRPKLGLNWPACLSSQRPATVERTAAGYTVTLRSSPRLALGKEDAMGLAIALIILALLIGGVGLVVEALWWMLIIAVVLVIAGAVAGWLKRGAANTRSPR